MMLEPHAISTSFTTGWPPTNTYKKINKKCLIMYSKREYFFGGREDIQTSSLHL